MHGDAVTDPLDNTDRPFVGPLELLLSPLARWRLFGVLGLVTFVVASAFTFVVRPRFEARAAFVPDGGQSSGLPTGLLSLVGQFGLPSGSFGAATPQFYVDLIKSRVIIRGLLNVRLVTNTGTARVFDLMDVHEPDSALHQEMAEEKLRKRVTVSFDRVTRRVDVAVWMENPQLAQAITDSLLMLVDAFDRDVRRSRAGNRRMFVEVQSARAADSLRAAESEMQAFLERNRTIGSPQLEFQRDRLARAISLRQEIFLALAREAEQSRVEEVDNRPVITIIDEPVAPARRFWPLRKKFVIIACLGVLAPAWVLLVLQELARTPVLNEGDAGHARARIRDAWADVRQTVGRRRAS